MGVHQTKKLLHSKRNNQHNERQPREWKKNLQTISDKWLICKLYMEFLYLNSEKSNMNLKQGQNLNRQFSKEDMQRTNQQMKNCLTSLIMRDIIHVLFSGQSHRHDTVLESPFSHGKLQGSCVVKPEFYSRFQYFRCRVSRATAADECNWENSSFVFEF